MRVIPSAQSDGKRVGVLRDPTSPRSKFAREGEHARSRPGMFFFGLREGSCRKRVGSGHVALGEVN
eukprot:2705835-Prymnesium_polylepis.1